MDLFYVYVSLSLAHQQFIFLESGGESIPFVPVCPGFDFQTRRHMRAEFVGSLLCSDEFFPGYSGFPPGTPVLPRVLRFCPGYSGFPLTSKNLSLIWFELISICSACPHLVSQCWKTWHNKIPLLNFLYGFTNRAVFKWLSKVIPWLRMLRLVIGFKDSRQFFNQWDAKPKPIAPCTRDFSRASSDLQVIARNCDWFMVLSAPVVIGQSNCFGFGFSTVIRKPLYAIWWYVFVR